MRIIYAYDSNNFFTKKVEQNLDDLTGEYPAVVFGTTKKIPDYNTNLEIPKFVNNAWILEDLKESGVFYLKTDATQFAEIAKKDADLYTEVNPLQKYNDGTTQAFIDATQQWEYTFKGDDLLEVERLKALKASKKVKFSQLETDYNYSKKIILQNGNTLVINHDTPERGIFISHLEVAKRVEKEESSVLSYHQKVGNVYLGFTALTYIWNYLFFKKFTNKRPSLTLEDKRVKNKQIYDVKKLKIENSNSIEELENINWSFESFTIININLEAQKLLDDPKTPAYVIDAINDPSLKGEDGQIHLIQQL